MSGYQYNLINEIPDLASMGVDIARISADSPQAFVQLKNFHKQLTEPARYTLDKVKECNGFWHKIPGMSIA